MKEILHLLYSETVFVEIRVWNYRNLNIHQIIVLLKNDPNTPFWGAQNHFLRFNVISSLETLDLFMEFRSRYRGYCNAITYII